MAYMAGVSVVPATKRTFSLTFEYSVGDIINKWRVETLELEPVPESEGPKLVERLAVPHTYCWSPGLVPKPSDWASHIGTSSSESIDRTTKLTE